MSTTGYDLWVDTTAEATFDMNATSGTDVVVDVPAQKLRIVSPTSRVLFMSGYTEDAVLRQSVMDPGTVFLDKPFTFDTLIRKVREALAAA